MCPDYRCIQHGGAHDGRVYLLSDIRTGAPVAPSSREQGIEEALSLASLVVDVVVPPQSSIQGESKVLGSGAVGDRMACHSNSPWGDSAGAGEENDLSLGGVEGEATVGPPLHQTVHSTLNAGDKEGRVGAAAEDRAIVSKGNSKGILVCNEADGLIEGQGPKAGRADTALGKAHTGGALSSEMAVVVGHIAV